MNETSHRPRMRLAGMLGEAWRDLITGTSHACALAVGLACLIVLLAGADWLTISGIQKQTDEYVASGGSTWILEYPNHIDGAACDRLISLDGVEAAGAVRQSENKLAFAALPSTSVPLYEITPGAANVFILSATGTQWRNGELQESESAPPNGGGALLSSEVAKPFQVQSGQSLVLKDGRILDIAGVFDWPDDGRKSGFSYAVLTPVPADPSVAFGQCWVRAWPQTDNIESLLRLASDGTANVTTAERPQIHKLNTTKGSELDSAVSFESRLTAYVPWIALAVASILGFGATRMRKLEMASALHCGVPKTALLAQIESETLAWTSAGMAMASPLLALVWLENRGDEARALMNTLFRVPVAAGVGGLLGACVAVLLTRENHLLKYFKNR
ncbi:hypothetical protein [Bifidobacterium olomucense]|uniref:ABC transporter permease n=1 Tax=Bifidobacterium olomucense TaxID=2675324 RepID=A0A7Y0HX53_9BIFI|nr:hypothetical protein [Bifidobacterium sp. DSM 109959]NMM97609.1 hypothetical protein [Bifidobacterium sp. DSM 109959]